MLHKHDLEGHHASSANIALLLRGFPGNELDKNGLEGHLASAAYIGSGDSQVKQLDRSGSFKKKHLNGSRGGLVAKYALGFPSKKPSLTCHPHPILTNAMQCSDKIYDIQPVESTG